MNARQYEIGMIGLSAIGRNLLLNMADHGHSVVGYVKDATKQVPIKSVGCSFSVGARGLAQR